MKLLNLLENLEFGSKDPRAEPLHVDQKGRSDPFHLKPDQSIREHDAPSSPFLRWCYKVKDLYRRRWR
jgi:hypothetical protein